MARGREQPGAEFKEAGNWDDYWPKVVKAGLAFPNLEGGGYLLIGIREVDDHRVEAQGVTPEQLDSYNHDEISATVHAYADPFVDLDVYSLKLNDGKEVVVVEFHEFTDIPVIAKKALDQAKVHEGRIYVRRSRGGVATTELPNQAEMRALLDLATRKMLRVWRGHAAAIAAAEGDAQMFDAELEGF